MVAGRANGLDGFLYLLTCNRDGRGPASPTDNRIFWTATLSELGTFGHVFGGSIAAYERTAGIGGTGYLVGYEIAEGELLEVVLDADANFLIVNINATGHSSLTLAIRIPCTAEVALFE